MARGRIPSERYSLEYITFRNAWMHFVKDGGPNPILTDLWTRLPADEQADFYIYGAEPAAEV